MPTTSPKKKAVKKAAPASDNVFARIFGTVKYELPVFAILLALFFPNRSDIAGSDVYVTMHIFDYRIGFAPRLFIGSMMSLFRDYKTVAFMNLFMDIFCIIALVLFAFAAGQVLRKTGGRARDAAFFIIVLFVAVPYSRSFLFPGTTGSISLDRFMAVYTLLAMAALHHKGIKWAVPILIFMGFATYHGFAFTLMPVIVILLIYGLTGERRSKENIALCVVSFAVAAVFSFYFFLYFDGLHSFKNIDELLAYAATKTDLKQAQTEFDIRKIVTAFLLGGSSEFLDKYRIPAGWGWTGFRSELISDLYLLPLFAAFFAIWFKAIKNSKSKPGKFVFALCLLAPLARVPMFVFSSYFARSRASVIVVQFFLILYFLYTGNQAVEQAVDKGAAFLRRYYVVPLLLIVYFAFFIKVL